MFGNRKGSGQDETYSNIIRYGKISSVIASKHMVRVTFPDKGGMVSHALPVLVSCSSKNKSYALPDVGEDVICLFLPNGAQRGFVIGSFYNVNNPKPVTSADKQNITFEDGTVVEYDRASHQLTINVHGNANITAQGGDVVVNGVSLVNHTHPDPQGGSTGAPNK
jgi:phage baseplate assembly protein V